MYINDGLGQSSREQARVDTFVNPTTNTVGDTDQLLCIISRVFTSSFNACILWNNDTFGLEECVGIRGLGYAQKAAQSHVIKTPHSDHNNY